MSGGGECRSCRAAIVWGTLNGKPHPLEPRVLVVITEDGRQVRGRESHFAYCPHAATHRKAGGQ